MVMLPVELTDQASGVKKVRSDLTSSIKRTILIRGGASLKSVC